MSIVTLKLGQRKDVEISRFDDQDNRNLQWRGDGMNAPTPSHLRPPRAQHADPVLPDQTHRPSSNAPSPDVQVVHEGNEARPSTGTRTEGPPSGTRRITFLTSPPQRNCTTNHSEDPHQQSESRVARDTHATTPPAPYSAPHPQQQPHEQDTPFPRPAPPPPPSPGRGVGPTSSRLSVSISRYIWTKPTLSKTWERRSFAEERRGLDLEAGARILDPNALARGPDAPVNMDMDIEAGRRGQESAGSPRSRPGSFYASPSALAAHRALPSVDRTASTPSGMGSS